THLHLHSFPTRRSSDLEDQVPDPNGLCFSPDYKKLYVVSTGQGPGDAHAGGKGDVFVFDLGADNKLSNGKLFSSFMIDGVKCGRSEEHTSELQSPYDLV